LALLVGYLVFLRRRDLNTYMLLGVLLGPVFFVFWTGLFIFYFLITPHYTSLLAPIIFLVFLVISIPVSGFLFRKGWKAKKKERGSL
jgi:membrane protein implicated in regulation of membrane protease activity